MPSTYTTNGGLELPGDGEQAGDWGDTVNTNMQILDAITNGQVTLTLDGTSSTLTTANAPTLSNGQNALIILSTGTISGTHTITIDPNDAEKIYFVYNTTAHSVVFTQGSGGNVTIATGDSAIIYANGGGASAAVANLTDHFAMSSVRITGGSITGITDLAVADGGTGASDASTARTNLGAQATVIGAASTVVTTNMIASRVAVSNASGKIDVSAVTTTELGYVSGVTSALQTQLNAKAPLTGTGTSGTWPISITGDAATTDGKSFGTFTAAGGIAYATSTTALAATAAGTAGQALLSGGAGAPTFGYPTQLSTATGSAPSYSCRAWVKFNGTGTVAINGSGNVSSITDNGTGLYTVNFTTALPDANYAAVGAVANTGLTAVTQQRPSVFSYSTTSVQLSSTQGSTATLSDTDEASVAVFR